MNKTRIISAVLAVFMLLCLMPISIAAQDLPMNITVSDVEAEAGETVSVAIAIDNNPGISSMRLNVEYGSAMTLTAIEYNAEMGGQYILPQTYESPVTLNWISPFENCTLKSTTFVTLTFTVSETASGGTAADITVTYDPEDIYNMDEENVECSVTNGRVTVSSNIAGDADGNGTLDNSDLTRIVRILAGFDVECVESLLDANTDGKVNNRDAIYVIQMLACWIDRE